MATFNTYLDKYFLDKSKLLSQLSKPMNYLNHQAYASIDASKPSLKPINWLDAAKLGMNQHSFTQLLSQFGLTSPDKILAFLRSPAGKIINALLEKQIIEEVESLEEYQQQQTEDNYFKHHRLLYLLLALLYQQAELKQTLQENYKKMRHYFDNPNFLASNSPEKVYQNYQRALSAVEQALIQQQSYLLELEKNQRYLEQALVEIDQSYEIHQQNLTRLEVYYSLVTNPSIKLNAKPATLDKDLVMVTDETARQEKLFPSDQALKSLIKRNFNQQQQEICQKLEQNNHKRIECNQQITLLTSQRVLLELKQSSLLHRFKPDIYLSPKNKSLPNPKHVLTMPSDTQSNEVALSLNKNTLKKSPNSGYNNVSLKS